MSLLVDVLGLGGVFLSLAGIAVALWGTRSFRKAVTQLGLLRPEPIIGKGASTLDDATSDSRGTTTPPPGEKPTEAEVRRDVDIEARRMVGNVERRLDQLRADVQATFDGIAAEAKKADQITTLGLVLAIIGAGLAFVAALARVSDGLADFLRDVLT